MYLFCFIDIDFLFFAFELFTVDFLFNKFIKCWDVLFFVLFDTVYFIYTPPVCGYFNMKFCFPCKYAEFADIFFIFLNVELKSIHDAYVFIFLFIYCLNISGLCIFLFKKSLVLFANGL